jgi:hypothetical protein
MPSCREANARAPSSRCAISRHHNLERLLQPSRPGFPQSLDTPSPRRAAAPSSAGTDPRREAIDTRAAVPSVTRQHRPAVSSACSPARHLARCDGSRQLPALPQQPALWPANHQRIVRVPDRPHEVLIFELLPVRKRDPTTEGIDQPGARKPVLILPVLPPVAEHVADRMARTRR